MMIAGTLGLLAALEIAFSLHQGVILLRVHIYLSSKLNCVSVNQRSYFYGEQIGVKIQELLQGYIASSSLTECVDFVCQPWVSDYLSLK